MENKLRRGLALLMTLIMLISCAPMDALAAIVPVSGGTQTSDGLSLFSIVKPPVATVTYVFMNGTEEFARQILKNGETLNNPGTPKADKEFVGWFDESGNQLTFPITASVGSASFTVTVNARFADVYFVFFTNEKGEVMVTKKGANGDTISTEGVTYPVGNEQSIIGWNYTGNEDDPLISEVKLEGKDVTLKAVVKDGHWITFDSQGGTYVEPAFVKGNGTTTAPAAPTRPGYTFDHWSQTIGGAAFAFGQQLGQELTLYAVWTANTNTRYTVIHWLENANDNEYSYAKSETKTGTTGAQTSAAAKSYTGFTAQNIRQQTIAGNGSTIVDVYYKRDVYTISFYRQESHTHTYKRKEGDWWNGYTYYGGCYPENGGTSVICGKQEGTSWNVVHTIKAKWDANVTNQWPKNINGTTDWRTSKNGDTYQVSIDRMPSANKSFYDPYTSANETQETETAYYYVESLPGGAYDTTYNEKNYYLHHSDTSGGSGFNVSSDDQYEITGFTFAGGTAIGNDYDGAKFYYTRNSYNIIYINNGVQDKVVSKLYEESIADAGSYTPTVKPAGMEDYVFGGWYADPSGKQEYVFTGETMPAQNVTVYAKWNKPVYNGTIYLTIEGTGSSITLSVPKGDTIETALNEKQAEIMAQVGKGYTWRGWRTGKDGTGEPFNPQTQITTDVILYPYYTKDGTFTVEYVSGKNDVTAPEDKKSYAEDSSADLMSPGKLVAADGEYFLGWSDGAATYQPRDKYQIKSNHANEQNVITLTAQWGARPAGTTLTYKANGGAGADVVENLANNATVTTKPADTFSRVGYTFKGWDTDPKGEGSIAPNTQVQVDNDGANVLYAIWTANTDTKYTVEFYYQNVGGTYTLNHSDKRTATTDTEVSVTDTDKAAKENNKYVFEADNKNNVLSGVVAGNGSLVLKLYFKLNTASYTIHHYLNGTTVKVAEDQTGAMTIGEKLTANKSDALYLAYAAAEVASYAPSQTITIAADESENVITVYYTMPLTIKAKDASKTYDGDPLTQPDFTMEGLVNGDTKENFSLSMTAASTITNAGSTPNVIDTATVKYNNGGEIPSYYNVSYKPGTLTVTPVTDKVTVTVTENSAEHTYDGNEHSVKGYASMTADNTLYDVTKSVKATETAAWTAKGTDAGEYPVGVAAGDFENTNKNFTNVTFNIVDGVLKINPITAEVVVTVTENGAIVTYDGTEHSVKGYKSMTADNKLYDVTKSVKATETAAWTAKGTDAGEYPVGVAAGDFENTNKNFTNVAFKIVDGVLKINPITEKTITITAKSASKTYDGTPLTDNDFTFTQGVLVKGDVLTAVVEGSATNVGDPGVNKVTSYVVTRGNKDVTGNYTFTDSVDGKLTINKRTVTLTSETASKEYDGTPLTKPEVAVTGDGFVAGEVSDITATGSVTFVHEGEVTNTITYTTGEKFNADNYTITKNEGKLSITKREGEGKTITVIAANGEKVYDGTPLTNNGFTHVGALVEGDVLTAVVEGSQTDVGVGDNVVRSYKVMRGDVNVTTSYTFTDSVKGALTVTLRDVTFTGESKSLPYTGGMQSITGITQSGLVEGHRYEGLTYKAEGQNVDSYDGAFSGDVVIKDAQGNDVTKNYNVTKTPGKLTITNASFTVTFTGENAEKIYNGKEQSITGITVDGLKTGHRYEGLTYEAKGTDKGEYVGAFTGTVKILDENNVDVTENYAITQTPGKLTITAVETEVVVTIEGDKKAFTYDGTEHSAKNYKVVRISNELYKEKDFTFTGTAEVKGTNANTYPMGLKEGNFQNTSNNFKNVRFVVTDGELVINKRPVKVTAEKLEYAYNYANPVAHPAEGVARCTVEAANGNRGLLAGDALNADVLYDGQSTQTLIGVYQAVAQIAAAKITNADGDVTANYTIEKVDSTLTIKGNDPIDPGKETTSVQTNYTVGDVIEYKITVKNVSKDEATNVVVTDSMAEIQDSASYTVSDDRHTATIASIPAGGTVLVYARHTVTAEDVENAYAGDANGSLTNVANIKFGDWNKDVEGDHDKLNDTYEYVVRYYWNNYTSVQPHEEKKLIARVGTEVTEEPAAIEGYTPVSADSRKLTISADQSKNVIEFYYYKNVALTANSKTETYDGTVKSVSDFTIEGENKDQDDQTIAADFSAITVGAQGIDAGEYPADFAENTVGTVDATGRYIVTAANNGKLVINPVTGQLIIITANSARKTYDGTPLTDNGFTFTEGVLADGDVLTAVVEGSATNVGDEGKNVVKSYAVKRGETDVTKNYTFGNSIDGKLTINKRKVTLKSADLSKTYDGTPLVNGKTALATEDGFVSGEGATYTFTGSQTVVGSSANAFTYTLNEGTNAGNYEVAKTEGTLTVTQNEKAITITANSHTWEYDGQAHSDGGYTVEYDGKTYKVEAGETATLPTGDVVKAKITKTVTNVSDSAAGNNTIDELTIVNAAGEDTKGQYKTVTLIPGTLTITKRGVGEEKVKITAADNTVEYDGQPHGAKLNAANQIEVGTSFTVTNLAEGHSVKTLAIEGSETDAGAYADKLVPGKAVIVDGNGVEVTANYDITYVPGTLTITKRGAGDMKVVLTAADNTVVYDGQSHGAKLNAAGEIEAGVSYTITNLANGHKVQSVVISGRETAVGEYENRLVPSGAKIVDAAGNDVTRNYVVGYKNGKLTITSPDTVIVTIRGNKDTVEYDGQKHEVNGYEVVSISNTLYTEADFGFADGATAHAEGTDAGEYPMNLTKDSFVNRNANFSAVTFVVTDGGLTITKRGAGENKVKITAADNTVNYDGQPHGAKLNAAGQIEVNVSYTTEYLAPGHKVQTVAIDGSETMVGVYEGRLVPKTAIIVDKNDNDVTRNYVITYVPGTLEIRKNETKIKVTANSHTWEYDGQPHSDGGYTVEYDGTKYEVPANGSVKLPTDDVVKATVEGTVTNVADSADDNNVVTNVTITNKTGTVVSDQYKTITRVNGGLKITRRGDSEDEDKKVKIIAEPNTVGYDGQSHGAKLNAAGEIELGTSYTTARLVEGHYVDKNTLDITGSQMNVGVYEEELKPAVKAGATRIVIRDKDGNDVTDNYALTLVNATLTITGDKLIPDKKAEDENIESNYKLGDEIEFTITVKNVSIYDVENVIVTDANAEIKAGNGYTVSADKHTATIAIIAAKSEIRIKALHTVTSEDILAGKVGNVANVTWKDGETTVTKTVDDDTTKLTPPDVKLTVTKTSDWEGKATGAKPELGTKITYTITVKNDGNVPYTNVNFTDLLQNGDASVTGEIPTYGTLPVNEEKSFTVEYIVTEADLLKESINNKVTAEADEIEYTYYEGKTEKTGKATPKGEAEVTDRTDDAKASTISTKTTTSKPKNEKGYELGETITYDIVVTNDGNLTVTSIEVVDNLEGAEIKAGSGYDVVNGKAVIAELKPGESVTVKVEYVVTEADVLAGKVVNNATVTGKGPGTDPEPDEPGTDDPTDEPKATLEIVKAVEGDPKNGTSYALGEKITYTLTVKVGADNNVTVKDIRVIDTLLTKANVDSGAVEIKGGYTLNATGEIELPDMAPGADDVVITYTYKVQESDLGSGKYGSVHNAAKVQGTTPDLDPENPNPKPDDPKDGDDNDTPTSIRLIITAKDNLGVEYDGQPHGAKLNDKGEIEAGTSYTITNLADGHKVQSVVISGSETAVGEYENRLVPSGAKIVDAAGNDVTSHYEIKYVPGNLKITQSTKELKVTANNGEWVYDGKQHSDGGYTVTYGNESYTVKAGESATLSTGDKVTAVVKGQVKDVDDTKAGNNEIVEWSVEHRDFYNNVTPANGTLTITPRKVTLKSDGGSKKYDGTPLTKPEVTVTGDGFVVGEVTGITATGSVTYVSQGEVDNLITFTKNEGFKDSNYEIKEIIGKLSIEALDVTIIITGPSAIREYKPGVTHTIVTGGSELDFVYGSDKVDGKIGVEGMVEGDKILPGTLKHTLEGMYVGEYEGVFTLFDSNGKKADKPTVMHDGVDVTENYKFSYNPGKLTITGKHMDGGKEVENEVPEKNYLLGQKIPFTITVRSVSKDELKDVTVTDPTATILPDRNTANPAYTVSEDEHTATITSLAPEAEVIVYAEHEVTEDDIINRYTNEATINWGNDEVKVSKTPSIEEENPEAELVKEIVLQDGQDENHKFKLGETVYFKITVTNTGNVTLNEYEVKEVLPGAAFIDGTGYTLNNDKTVATIEKMEPVKDGQEAPDSNQIVLYAQYNIKEEDLGNKELKNIVTADNSKPGEVPIPVDEAKSVSGQKIWKDEGNAFNTRPASITLTLMRKLGQNGAAEQYRTMQLGSNGSWRYSFDHLPKHDAQENEYFYWVVEEPVTGYDTAYETKDESHCDIVNNLQTYTLTIHYWQHKLGDTKMEQAFPDYVATLYYKQPYDVESPEREGIILDDMSQARISGTMPAHDLVIDVYYHRIAYRLTIHYIYQDGTMAHEDYTWTYWFNSTYNVPSPIIPGFTPSIDVIAGRMPSHGLELTVVYVGDSEIVIPDEDTSLGFKSYLNAGECFE